MSIHTFLAKIKSFWDGESRGDWLGVIIIVLVACASFGLGRLSKMPPTDDTVAIVGSVMTMNGSATASKGASTTASLLASSGAVVASKNGTKYYYPSCSGISRIAAENKVTFASAQEAEVAGYTIASTCK